MCVRYIQVGECIDAAISSPPLPPPPQRKESPKECHEDNVVQRLKAAFRLHKGPPIGDSGENNRRHGTSQLLGALGFRHCDSHMDFSSSNPSYIWGGAIAASLSSETNSTVLCGGSIQAILSFAMR